MAIVGCGATGSALASLLARAGVGTLRIIDRDYVEASNLQRQSLFEEKDAAESLPKAIAAARKISTFNSEIVVEARVEDLVPRNINVLLDGMDVILDGTDNFETRYLVNDYAVKDSIPWIYAAAVGSYGVTLNVLPGKTACLACIFPDTPTRDGGNMRDLWNIKYGGEPGGLDCGDGGDEVAGRAARRGAAQENAVVVRRLENEHAEIAAAKSAAGLPGVRRAGFCASGGRGASAYHDVRAQLGADSRARAAD